MTIPPRKKTPNSNGANTATTAELAQLYANIARRSGDVLAQFLDSGRRAFAAPVADELGIARAFFEAWGKLLSDPIRLAETQMKLWQDYLMLWQHSVMKLMGHEVKPVAEPPHGDRRFRHEDWEKNFLYDYLKQSYLIAAKHLHQALGKVEGLDEPFHMLVKVTPGIDFGRIEERKGLQGFRQVGRLGHMCPFDQQGNDGNPAAQGGLDFDPDRAAATASSGRSASLSGTTGMPYTSSRSSTIRSRMVCMACS